MAISCLLLVLIFHDIYILWSDANIELKLTSIQSSFWSVPISNGYVDFIKKSFTCQ